MSRSRGTPLLLLARTDAEAQKILNEINQQVKADISKFAALAQKYSEVVSRPSLVLKLPEGRRSGSIHSRLDAEVV